MIVSTQEICAHLMRNGFDRDKSQPYGPVGYRSENGEWLVIDDEYVNQDTGHLIEDCVANGCYAGAAIIKKWVEEKAKEQ